LTLAREAHVPSPLWKVPKSANATPNRSVDLTFVALTVIIVILAIAGYFGSAKVRRSNL
jgi:hypothetical protein